MKNKKLLAKVSSGGLILGLLVTFTHCVQEQTPVEEQNSKSSNNTKKPTGDTTKPPTDVVNDDSEDDVIITNPNETTPTPPKPVDPNAPVVAMGVKDFEEIDQTMSHLTGVKREEYTSPGSNKTVFGQVKMALPTDNDITGYLATNQVAVTKLASRYCNDLLNDEKNITYRSHIWPDINLTAGWSEFNLSWKKEKNVWVKEMVSGKTVAKDNLSKVIDNMLLAFWGDGVVPADDLNHAHGVLSKLAVEMAQGEPQASGETSKSAIKSICTVALSSPYVTLK